MGGRYVPFSIDHKAKISCGLIKTAYLSCSVTVKGGNFVVTMYDARSFQGEKGGEGS